MYYHFYLEFQRGKNNRNIKFGHSNKFRNNFYFIMTVISDKNNIDKLKYLTFSFHEFEK